MIVPTATTDFAVDEADWVEQQREVVDADDERDYPHTQREVNNPDGGPP